MTIDNYTGHFKQYTHKSYRDYDSRTIDTVNCI